MIFKRLKHQVIALSLLAMLSSSTATYGYTLSDCTVSPENLKSLSLYDISSQFNVVGYETSTKMGIASISKLMTAKILMDALDRGDIHKDDLVYISPNAQAQDGDGLRLRAGDYILFDDLFHGMLINSSNDAAVALAEYYAGTTQAFAELMNQEAQRLGLGHSSFVNPSGLTEYDANNETKPEQNNMTMNDLMQLVSIIEATHPEIHAITDIDEWAFETKGITRSNTNVLLDLYPEVNGLKTGFTNYAGYCQVVTANLTNLPINTALFGDLYGNGPSYSISHDREIALSVLGAKYKSTRTNTLKNLMTFSKDNLEIVALTDSKQALNMSLFRHYTLYATEDVTIANLKGKKIDSSLFMNPIWHFESTPADGTVVGKIIFYSDHDYITEVPVIARLN